MARDAVRVNHHPPEKNQYGEEHTIEQKWSPAGVAVVGIALTLLVHMISRNI